MSVAELPTANTITPQSFAQRIASGERLELIDVRTPAEFREVHLECAHNVPLDQLDPKAIIQKRGESQEPLYVICKAGGRGQQACSRFQAVGFPNVINVEGGTQACVQAGLPVVRGKKAMALERQVRIAAGSMILLGFALSFLHPYFLGLSAFVGAGLVFAGVTDTCAMGMMLAKMPWNR